MKTRILLYLTFFLFFYNNSNAQEGIFKVLISKGDNQVVSGDSEDWREVKIGTKLLENHKIRLGENSYLGLSHQNGKTIELKTPGIYDVKKLSLEVARQNQTAGKKYLDFVAGEMTAKDEDMAKNRHKYMAVTGSVERSTEESGIKLFLPKKTIVLNGLVYLFWQPVVDASAYIVNVTNLAEEVVFSIEASSNTAVIDFAKIGGKKEKQFLVSVSLKENPKFASSKSNIQKVLDDKQLLKEIEDLKLEYPEETALNKLVMAAFYEEKKLLGEAVACYEQAIKLEPEVEGFQVAYADFLERSIFNK
jgi:hypothetical protein